MKALRSDLIKLFEQLGWATASKWSPKKMKDKLSNLIVMVKDEEEDIPELEDEDSIALLNSMMKADGDVEIVSKASDLDELPIQDGADVSTVEQVRKLNHGEDGACFVEETIPETEPGEAEPDDSVVEEEPVVEEKEDVVEPPKKKRKQKKSKAGMGLLSAGIEVLHQSDKSLKVKEIMAKIKEQGLWKSLKGGKTPEATLAAGIYTNIKQKGKKSVFEKVAKGTFRLRR